MAVSFSVLVLGLCLVGCRGFLLDDNSLQNLLSLISQEKSLRASLEQEIMAVKSEINAIRTSHQASLCNCPASGVVAFSATITSDVTNFGTAQPLVFDKVITNVGGAYDNRHGSFSAPVSGIYKFAFSILQGTSAMWIGLELVVDNNVVGRIKTGDNGYYNMGSNVISLHLDAGNDVWVRHMTDSDGKRVVSGGSDGGFTMFSGHLVRAD